jgi:hypothetical protein
LLVVTITAFAACGNDGFATKIERENVDGVECVVVRNPSNGKVRAIDCDWENAEEGER